MKKLFLISWILCSIVSYSQINEIKKFPYTPLLGIAPGTSSLIKKDNVYYMFYMDTISSNKTKLLVSQSASGVDWDAPQVVVPEFTIPASYYPNIEAAVFKNKIAVLYKGATNYNYLTYYDGSVWSEPVKLGMNSPIYAQAAIQNVSFSATSDSLYLAFPGNIGVSADLINWSYRKVTLQCKFLSMICIDSNKKAYFYESVIDTGKIYMRIFENNTFSDSLLIIPSDQRGFYPKAVLNNDGSVYVAYNILNTAGPGIPVYDIAYVKSSGNLSSWSAPVQYTSFKGLDWVTSVSPAENFPLISFYSERNAVFNSVRKIGVSYGLLTTGQEKESQIPWVFKITPAAGNYSLNIKAAIDGMMVTDIKYITYKVNNIAADSIFLFDDGMHNDSLAFDKIWGNDIAAGPQDAIEFSVNIKRGDLIDKSLPITVYIPVTGVISSYLFNSTIMKLPIDNRGVLADISVNGTAGGMVNNKVVLYAGGFLLSGKIQNELFANGVASASRVNDYEPGTIAGGLQGRDLSIYSVKLTDQPFGDKWLKWKDAVMCGAEFYDGNGDGIYNPVDLDFDGYWSPNEDKPMIIGDETVWCVYNDGIVSGLRSYTDAKPVGLEIQQTIFGSHNNNPLNNNITYVRYKITNRSFTHQDMDSVYFTGWNDVDLGDPYDDLVGCDTLLQGGFTYNDGGDTQWGSNPPALMNQLLQGPQVYIPGETFIDNNSNGVFDEGSDTPLDTAYAKFGHAGMKVFPGAKNLKMSSFGHYQQSDPTLGDPSNMREVRNYQLGLTKTGTEVNPCTWALGKVVGGVQCSPINNKFWYSGDPISNIGWLNSTPADQRTEVNVGPFNIAYGKSVDLIFTYDVGIGSDAKSSLVQAKQIAQHALLMYQSNFRGITVGVNDSDKDILVKEYRLSQNYPNPFNPTTTIAYAIAKSGLVTLRVYDVLGRERAVLLNEHKEAGSYKLSFNGSELPSGVYFYKLESGSFSQTRKFVLIK